MSTMNHTPQTLNGAHSTDPSDVLVIGGGLAGLTAATLLARAGQRVRVLEKSRHLGGRAMTEQAQGFHFNLGPHALYRGGPAYRILTQLGLALRGGVPGIDGIALRDGRGYTLPTSFQSILTTGLLSLRGKFDVLRLLATFARLDPTAFDHMPLQTWLDRSLTQPDARQFVATLFRVWTYSGDTQHQSAGAALAQGQIAVAQNVLYLDGGWQTLVDGLRQAAERAGAEILTSARAKEVIYERAGVRGVALADGAFLPAGAVVLATSPAQAAELVPHHAQLRQWAEAARPVKAACLDVALRRLPRPENRFALGVDHPFYFQLHSAYARLAPEGHALIHLSKYLDGAPVREADAVAQELEGVLDQLQPGWRDELITRRFLPQMTVSNALVTAEAGGTAERPPVALPDVPHLYLAGDWVGARGMLADASLASAEHAAQLIQANGGQRRAVAAGAGVMLQPA